MAVVAKCNHCLFEIDFKSVEQDLNNDCKIYLPYIYLYMNFVSHITQPPEVLRPIPSGFDYVYFKRVICKFDM